jgi:hypothetical protein
VNEGVGNARMGWVGLVEGGKGCMGVVRGEAIGEGHNLPMVRSG